MGCESVRELVCAWQCSRCRGWKSEQDRHVTCPEGVHNPGLLSAHRRFLLGFSIKPCSPGLLSPALWSLMAPTRFPKSLGKHRAKAMNRGGGGFENAFEVQQPEEATCPCRSRTEAQSLQCVCWQMAGALQVGRSREQLAMGTRYVGLALKKAVLAS